MARRHAVLALVVAVCWAVNFVVIDVVPAASLCGAALRTDRLPAVFFVPRPDVLAGSCRRRPVHLCRPVRAAVRGDEHWATRGAHVGDRTAPAGVTIRLAALALGERPNLRQVVGACSPWLGSERSPPAGPTASPSGSRTRYRVVSIMGVRECCDSNGRDEAVLVAPRVVARRAPVPLLGLSLIFEGTSRWQTAATSIDAPGIAALAYVVIASTFFGYGVWYRFISRHPASTVAPFTLLVPVVGIFTAWLARGEHPTGGELLGSLIVLVGLAGRRSGRGTKASCRRRCCTHAVMISRSCRPLLGPTYFWKPSRRFPSSDRGRM
jgi:O-acetylserine/cysteine efflux transporter